jgi:hypothetical protein
MEIAHSSGTLIVAICVRADDLTKKFNIEFHKKDFA